MRGRNTRKIWGAISLALSLVLLIPVAVPAAGMEQVYATEDGYEDEYNEEVSENHTKIKYLERSSDRVITDDDRADADADMLYYMQSLEVRYKLDAKVMENLHKVFDSAVYYIANTEMTLTEMWSYVASAKSSMESAAVEKVTMTTSEFLQVADNWETPIVSYGQAVSIVLPVVNFGTEELNNLIIEPVTSTLVTEWPFEPDMTNYLQTEPFIPGCAWLTKLF